METTETTAKCSRCGGDLRTREHLAQMADRALAHEQEDAAKGLVGRFTATLEMVRSELRGVCSSCNTGDYLAKVRAERAAEVAQ